MKVKASVEQDPCTATKCLNGGKCKRLKDTTQGFCQCPRMFHGPTCEESVRDLIDFAAIEAQLDSIVFMPVPDLTSIYYTSPQHDAANTILRHFTELQLWRQHPTI
uniref:EGF-like domain-containing protein n=1 Tax=Esox lucius TaxID=8010 RepID=A0AAY5KAR5_ESOLU